MDHGREEQQNLVPETVLMGLPEKVVEQDHQCDS